MLLVCALVSSLVHFTLQMTLKLGDRLRNDTLLFIRLSSKAFVEKWSLDAKFRLVASRLRAEPLGFCLLMNNSEYPL